MGSPVTCAIPRTSWSRPSTGSASWTERDAVPKPSNDSHPVAWRNSTSEFTPKCRGRHRHHGVTSAVSQLAAHARRIATSSTLQSRANTRHGRFEAARTQAPKRHQLALHLRQAAEKALFLLLAAN